MNENNLPLHIVLLLTLVTAILGPIILETYKYFLGKLKNKKEPANHILESLEDGMVIKEQIDSIKDEYNCDRVWITQFHNGGHYYPYKKSILKFSTTFESTTNGINKRSTTFKNLPVSLFNRSFMKLLDKNEIFIPDVEDIGIEKYNLEEFYPDPPKSIYLFSLKDFNNKFIGTLGLEWVNSPYKLTPTQIHDLRNKAISMGVIIGTYLSSNNN